MKFSLIKLLRGRDAYGHPIGVNFKGDDHYQTLLGGVLTFVAQALTLVLCVRAVIEIFEMEDPSVTVFERLMQYEER